MDSSCSSPLDSSVEVLEVSEKKTLGIDDDSVIDLATSEEDEDSDSILLQTSPRKDEDDENDDETLEDICQGVAEEGETIEVTCLDDNDADEDSLKNLKDTKSNFYESIILELSDCEGDDFEHEVGRMIENRVRDSFKNIAKDIKYIDTTVDNVDDIFKETEETMNENEKLMQEILALNNNDHLEQDAEDSLDLGIEVLETEYPADENEELVLEFEEEDDVTVVGSSSTELGQGAREAKLPLPSDSSVSDVLIQVSANDTFKWIPGRLVSGSSGDEFINVELEDGKERIQVPPARVAHLQPPDSGQVKVGARCIVTSSDAVQLGVVAEPAKLLNRSRVLVFQDCGEPRYVAPRHLRTVYSGSLAGAGSSLHQLVLGRYLDNYPENPLLRLAAGDTVKVRA